MSDMEEMNLDTAIGIMAHWSIWQMYEQWLEREDLWETEYPDFGENDVLEIVEHVERIMPTDVTLDMFEDAHKVFADRATGAEV